MEMKNERPRLYYLETHLCDHCNLNCKGCGHFSPLVSEIFADLEQFTKDMWEITSKIRVDQLRLMGGEPLLHPQVNEFIAVAREAFPKTDIRIVTNGVLLPTMPKSFWETLRNNRIVVDMSKYPVVGNKFAEYLDLLDDNDIPLGIIHLSKRFYSQTNYNGDSDIKETYYNCGSKNCVNLWHSKIYNCPACYVSYFNEYFNDDIPVPEGIDIYKFSGEEIVEKMYKPISQCKFCDTKNLKCFDWAQSANKFEEWFIREA